MSEPSQTNAAPIIPTSRGWTVLSVGIAALIGAFLMWMGFGLLAAAGNVVGGAFLPMGRSSLTDAQSFFVTIVYFFSIVSFAVGLLVLFRSVRRLLA